MKKNIFHSFALLSFILFLLTTAFSCSKDNIVTPPELQPGRRDYTWTVDTIDAPDNTYYRMWGSSPTDLWAVSSGSLLSKSIANFNGSRWFIYYVPGMNNPYSIWGFTYNNIYIGTAGGGIWKFDGANWKKFAELTKDGHTNIVFDNIWGESSTDFYAFGAFPDSIGSANESVIAHFINNNWIMLNTDGLQGIVEHLYKNSLDGKIYAQVVEWGDGLHYDSTHIFEYDQNEIKQIYSSVLTVGQQADISLINNEVYFILGNQIAKRSNGQFQTFLQVDNPNFYQRIWGRNSKDIFLLMTDGLVHYNGSNIEYLFHFNKSRTQIFGAALFEMDVFFLVSEVSPNLNLVYHGKLR